MTSPLQTLSLTDTYSLDRNLCELQSSKYCWYPRASNRFLLFPQLPSLCTTGIINCSVSFLLLNCFSPPQPFCIVFQSLFLHLCLPPPICLHFETYASYYMLMSYSSFYPINWGNGVPLCSPEISGDPTTRNNPGQHWGKHIHKYWWHCAYQATGDLSQGYWLKKICNFETCRCNSSYNKLPFEAYATCAFAMWWK